MIVYTRSDFEKLIFKQVRASLGSSDAPMRYRTATDICNGVTSNIHLWFHQLDSDLYENFSHNLLTINKKMLRVYHCANLDDVAKEYTQVIARSKFVSAYIAKQRLNRITYTEYHGIRGSRNSSLQLVHNRLENKEFMSCTKVLGQIMKDLPNIIASSSRMISHFQSPFVGQTATVRKNKLDDQGVHYRAQFGYYEIRVLFNKYLHDTARRVSIRIEPCNTMMNQTKNRLDYRYRLYRSLLVALNNIPLFDNVETTHHIDSYIEVAADFSPFMQFEPDEKEVEVVEPTETADPIIEEGICDIHTLMNHIRERISICESEINSLEDTLIERRNEVIRLNEDLTVLTSSVAIMERHVSQTK